jgi:pimeloyl-ACP methyl ester carboxylesterase
VIVGMSLGGTTTIRLAAKYPELVRRAVIVDATPASRDSRPPLTSAQQGATALLEGPSKFASFEDIVRATAAALPDRPLDWVRAGVLRNAREADDGSWVWRYDPGRPEQGSTPQDRSLLWEDLAAIRAPVMLVRAGRSGRVLDEDVAEFCRRQPAARVEVVAESGHSVQADQPQILASLITEFLVLNPRA